MLKQERYGKNTVTALVGSNTLFRISRLFKHIFPNKNVQGILYDSITLQTEKKKHFLNLLCINCAGNTHHLTIANAVQHEKEFQDNDYLQRSLLNTSNDAINFANMISRMTDGHLDFSVHGNITTKDVKRLIRDAYQQITPENSGLILFWSGHGRAVQSTPGAVHIRNMKKELHLEMESYDERVKLLPISSIVTEWHHLQKGHYHPLLLVLDCCHSGLAVHDLGTWGNTTRGMCLVITSCSDKDVSGGWVMDGTNTGGILTNFLTDPIATYFKVQYNVFYDFGGTIDDKGSSMYKFYQIFLECVEQVITDCELRPVFDRIRVRAGDHVATLFKHLMLLVQYGHKLHHPQYPKSFPDVSTCAGSQYWSTMETQMEELMLELWEERYNEATS
jgi:hypothetical protein